MYTEVELGISTTDMYTVYGGVLLVLLVYINYV